MEKGGAGGAQHKIKLGLCSPSLGPPPGFTPFSFPGFECWGELGRGKTFSPGKPVMARISPRAPINPPQKETKGGVPPRGAALLEFGVPPGLGPGLSLTGAAFYFFFFFFFFFFAFSLTM
eukprot:FR735652.1.p2 GENE.FR735652.1~~FR735652.1.p2  ORF type:complete len:120 (-),score=66.88 FR735652.1:739-1098(-)